MDYQKTQTPPPAPEPSPRPQERSSLADLTQEERLKIAAALLQA
jgi:hypothetical protein